MNLSYLTGGRSVCILAHEPDPRIVRATYSAPACYVLRRSLLETD